jgi:hemerythrin-like domain-containing protein
MSKLERDTPQGLCALLTREHQELEQLFQALLDALQADAREDAIRLWAAFDDGLSRHMALEEKELLPLLQLQDAPEVAALLREHDEIRAKLTDLGVGVDLHEIRVQTVSEFIDQLRRHAKREDALAYRWAEKNLPPGPRDEVQRAVGEARAQRRRVLESGRKAKVGGTASR